MTEKELNIQFVEVKDAAYRYAVSLLHNTEEAEDLVQDLYEKLWRRRLLVRTKGFVQLVMVSVRNMSFDILRARQNGHGAIHRDTAHTEDWYIGEPVCEASEENEEKDIAVIAGKLIDRLPDREREAFHLRVVEGLEYQLVAEIMGVTETAARMACSRGKNRVKEELVKILGYGLERK